MRNRFLLSSAALVLGLSLVAGACSSDSDEASTTTEAAEETTTTEAAADTSGKTVVAIAVDTPDFSTLVQALTAAKLADVLSGEGPYTVFAPTDAAFDALPAGTLTTLLADPEAQLADILKLHVIAGNVDAAAATAAVGTCVESLGGPILIGQDANGLTYGGAPITATDIVGSNGTIHVIDGVVTAASTDCPA